jgi:tetratricopeptide (TPR) repeat protein
MVEEDFQKGKRMTSYLKTRRSLRSFTAFALLFFLMAGCMKFKKKTEPAIPLPEKTRPTSSILPSENAAATLIQEGWESMNEGHLLLAEQKFENALRISPTSGESYLGLASVAHLQHDYQRALEFLQIGEAYSTQRTDLLLRFYLLEGDCYRALGKEKEAQKAYQKALEIDPDSQALIERSKKMQ